jgi:biopolymer transport protein ExbB
MQDELATTPATVPADAMPATDPAVDASATVPMSAGEAVPPADPASLDVSSALPEGMDRLDLLMGNTDSLALTKMGFAHLVQHADAVGLLAFTVMAVMSVLVWYYVLYNFLRLWVVRSRADRVITAFWESGSPREAMGFLRAQPEIEPFSKIAIDAAFAAEHHSDALGGRMAEALSRHEFIDRAVRSAITRESHRFDSGLTLLASVGSTAPFVGLFGTVWGIYHALINIGASGEATLDVVAGPVGEALIMTCIGLGVAIPSVLAYNYFVRSNKAMLARFNAFGHDLLDYFATGARVRAQRYGTKQHVPSAG